MIVTPWYPSPRAPYHGAFVRDHALAVSRHADDTTVVHVDAEPAANGASVHREVHPEGDLLRVTIPLDTRRPRAEVARAHADALRQHAADAFRRADVVHAHVGLPSGWAASTTVPARARFFVTEHASYLTSVLATPDARELYEQMLRRCDRYWVVSRALRDHVRDTFPELADRIHASPNPIRFDRLPDPPARRTALRRWLYVGTLAEPKGVFRLLRAFAACAPARYGLTLTMVGQGPVAEELRRLAAELGVADRVSLPGAVPPERIGAAYAGADLLVHLSESETFGVTALEAAAAGLCVIVTRCGGPEETLDEVAALGGVRFVPTGGDTTSVVEAFHDLRASLETVDLRSDGVLRTAYSAAAVGRLTVDSYGWAVDDARPPASARVLAVDLGGVATADLGRSLETVLRHGGSAVLLTARQTAPVAKDDRVTVMDLRPLDRGAPRPPAVDTLTVRLPGLALRAARRAAGLLPDRAGRVSRSRARTAVDRLRGRHTGWVAAFRRRYRARYGQTWPKLLVGPAARGPGAALRGEGFDLVIAATDDDARLAARLTRGRPRPPMSRPGRDETIRSLAAHAARRVVRPRPRITEEGS